jgi:hypothetical protein
MDIRGLVNHSDVDVRRPGSLSPLEHAGSDSARSQQPIDPATAISSLPISPISLRTGEDLHSPVNVVDRNTSPSVKRSLDATLPTTSNQPHAKRRAHELTGTDGGKIVPTRRRALQACEACRAKKSKCDNERPSCGSCILHGVECIYKGTPFVPL